MPLIGAIVAAIMALSALSILRVDEAPPKKQPLWPLLRSVLLDTLATARSRAGWTGLLICLSPVGTVAASGLFGAIADDYHATSGDVILATGLVFGVSNAIGSLVGGFLADRIDRRKTYLLSGVLTAVCAFSMAFAPRTPFSYLFWALAYGVASGLAYAAFYAFVFEMIEDSPGATTKFGLFIGISNLAISYVTFLDGLMYKPGPRVPLSGASGVLSCDGALNLLGVVLIGALMVVVRRRGQATSPVAAPADVQLAGAG
jgi:MFS family permease